MTVNPIRDNVAQLNNSELWSLSDEYTELELTSTLGDNAKIRKLARMTMGRSDPLAMTIFAFEVWRELALRGSGQTKP